MEDKFQEQYTALRNKVMTAVKEAVKAKKKIVFYDEETDEGEKCDVLLDLLMVSAVHKHGMYEEYSVVSISYSFNELFDDAHKHKFTLHATGRGDLDGVDRDFDLAELDFYNLCDLADDINKLK